MKYHLPVRIRELRESKGMTLADVGTKLHVHPTVISGWETGDTEPDITQRMMLARVMGVSYLGLTHSDIFCGVRNTEASYGFTRNGFV